MPKSKKANKPANKPATKPATVLPLAVAPATDAKPATKPAKQPKPALRPKLYAAYRAELEIDRASVPIKPASQFKPDILHAGTCANFTLRQARAFRYLANRAGVKIEKAGATVPRFTTDTDGVRVCLENGCGRDMLGAGLVTQPSGQAGTEPDAKLILSAAGFVFLRDNALIG